MPAVNYKTTNLFSSSDNIDHFTVAEFFAGIGLMRMGLEKYGWRVTFANDIDPLKKEMYEAHFGQTMHYCTDDVHLLHAEKVPDVTLATASFPCTDLSNAGAREGLRGKQSSAFWGFTRILEELKDRKPPLILIENVFGFLTSHKGKDFQNAMLELNRLGYRVDPFIVDSIHFVPQSRVRLFVVGCLNSLFPASEPVEETQAFYQSEARPAALADYIFQHPEIDWHIRPLPPFPTLQKSLADILEDIPPQDSAWWNRQRTDYLLSQMSPRHRNVAEQMINAQKWSFGTVFRRMRQGKSTAELRTDGIAGCLRTPKGGSAKQILFKAGFGQSFARLISSREAARLMGADDFIINVSLNQALFGFGDAVCVDVVQWIAKNYLNPLAQDILVDVARRQTA